MNQQTLQDFAKSHGFSASFPLDGNFYRYDRSGPQTGYFKGFEIVAPSGRKLVSAIMGDWKTDEKLTYKSWQNNGSGAGDQEAEVAFKTAQEKAARELAERQEAQALASESIWNKATQEGSHEYLAKKGFGLFEVEKLGCCVDTGSIRAQDHGPQLLVPMRDATGKLWGVQSISADGFKSFPENVRMRGSFHVINPNANGETLYVTEGIATAASVAEATGAKVYVAFNAGNLKAVAQAARAQHPQAEIVIAGDDDCFTHRPDGSKWNPGREKAEAAAQAVSGTALFPVFREPNDKRLTDFNDLHAELGLEAVIAQLAAGLEAARAKKGGAGAGDQPERAPAAPGGEFDRELRALGPVLKKGKDGEVTPTEPPQQQVADALASVYEGRLIKQGQDLFVYTGTHWKILTDADRDRLKMQIQDLCGGRATIGKIESVFALFMIHCESVPPNVNMFAPSPLLANFANGTLHVTRDKKSGKYSHEFRPHSKLDYVTWVIPIDYDEKRRSKNALLEKLLDEVFENDPDKPGKIRSLKQCAGAMLLPAFPQIFMLHGKHGSRKSTLAKVFMRLMSQENYSTIEPWQMEGFHLEDMISKLVNIKTDIATKKPFPDGFLKTVEDRVPIMVNRKGRKVVKAMIPGVHVFCCNDLPPMLDGGKAYGRRITLIEFEKNFTDRGEYTRDYDELVFEAGAGGLLDFATEGLLDLLASGGIFSAPESGKASVEEWQAEGDAVEQFFRDVSEGKIAVENSTVKLGKDFRMKPAQLWEAFCAFHLSTTRRDPEITRFKFYRLVSERGVKKVAIKGNEHFAGIGIFEVESAKF